jgi:hypothetical protein
MRRYRPIQASDLTDAMTPPYTDLEIDVCAGDDWVVS